jgi:hypothetical protein
MLATFVTLETLTLWLYSRIQDDSNVIPMRYYALGRCELDMRALATGGMLLTIGLVIGMQSAEPVRAEKRWHPPVAVIGWVVLVLLVLAAATEAIVIPYLVLLAMDALSHATRFWEGNGSGAVIRLSHGLVPVALSLVSCVPAGVWQSHRLRGPRTASSPPAGRAIRVGNAAMDLLSLLAPATAAIYVMFLFLPSVHTQFAEGLWQAIRPLDRAVVTIGFAGLGAGITARSMGTSSMAPRVMNIPASVSRDSILPIALVTRIVVAIVTISLSGLVLPYS